MSNKENDQFNNPESNNRSLLNGADAEETLSPPPPARDSMSLSVGSTEAGKNTEKHTGTDAFLDAELNQKIGSSGAPPSNTAPANCINDSKEPIKILRCGIDSLYLSYLGDINFSQSIELDTLKKLAQSEHEIDQAQAVYELPGHHFQVNSSGYRKYAYVLVDNAYRICLSSIDAKKMPLAYVQIKSDWLVLNGVQDAVVELDVIIESFGCFEEEQIHSNISRADLFVDFVCDLPFEDVPKNAWVRRAQYFGNHFDGTTYTGCSIGRKGPISARLYDKTIEIEASKKHYLKDIWREKGWDGESRVWRLEFQYMRPLLKEHGAGTVEELLNKLSSLWQYSMTSWLKMTIPSETDTTQSRWPLHPVWKALSQVDWGVPIQPVSVPIRSFKPPSDRFLFINGLSSISSFMAREGINGRVEM